METPDTTWKKVDPAKLRREAEAKEAKLKRQQEQRVARAEARKEKRHAKSEAKQARKLNVGRAAKWNAERRAADKLKKLANRPHKQEKRRRRLRLRADKLEQQAQKMMLEAQKARVRADLLDEQKAKEEEEKGRLTREVQQMAADPNNDNFIPLDDTAPATAVSATTDSSSDSDSSSSEEELKKQKKVKKAEKKRKRKVEEDKEPEPTNDAMDIDGAEEALAPKGEKKKKKRKVEQAVEETGSQEEAGQSEPRKEKKEKKDKKDKKKKRKEKDHAEEYVPSTPAEGGASTNGGEQWNVEALEGDTKRKEKFLRLLGGKKPNGEATTNGHNASSTSRSNITQVQNDLERQFDTGMRMKHDGQGHKRGLGA